jgi:hypothetical protein
MDTTFTADWVTNIATADPEGFDGVFGLNAAAEPAFCPKDFDITVRALFNTCISEWIALHAEYAIAPTRYRTPNRRSYLIKMFISAS